MSLTAFNDENFQTEVIDSALPVMVDFYATWCGPCKALTPIVEKLAGDYEGKLKVGKLNIDDLITHTMPLDDINTAFDLMHSGESIRSVVQY